METNILLVPEMESNMLFVLRAGTCCYMALIADVWRSPFDHEGSDSEYASVDEESISTINMFLKKVHLPTIKPTLHPTKLLEKAKCVKSEATNNPMGRYNRTVYCVAGQDLDGNAVPWFAIEISKTASKGHHMQWFEKEVKADNKTRLVLSNLSDWVAPWTVVAEFPNVALVRTLTECVVEVPFTENQLQVAQTAVAAYKDEIALESSRLPVKKRPTIV